MSGCCDANGWAARAVEPARCSLGSANSMPRSVGNCNKARCTVSAAHGALHETPEPTRACSHYFCQMRCNPKEPGARRQTKLGCGPSEAWQRRGWLFWVATRREGHANGATRCCVPGQGPGLGVVTRLDWRRLHGLRTGENSVNRPYHARRCQASLGPHPSFVWRLAPGPL